jgi:XTP/dITP diphosphohydrolase
VNHVRFVLATQNPGKVAEMNALLGPAGIEVISAAGAGVHNFPPETGGTYEANALIKAQHVTHESGLPALADDSGLEVDALSGEPGVHTARFGGEGLTQAARNDLLLNRLVDVPEAQRTARFRAVIALVHPGDDAVTFEGVCEGRILEAPAPGGGFGYDPVFYSFDLRQAFSQASKQDKNRVSHRGRALTALLDWLRASAPNTA